MMVVTAVWQSPIGEIGLKTRRKSRKCGNSNSQTENASGAKPTVIVRGCPRELMGKAPIPFPMD